jgi:hypothetical protein
VKNPSHGFQTGNSGQKNAMDKLTAEIFGDWEAWLMRYQMDGTGPHTDKNATGRNAIADDSGSDRARSGESTALWN